MGVQFVARITTYNENRDRTHRTTRVFNQDDRLDVIYQWAMNITKSRDEEIVDIVLEIVE